ncbi:Hsp20/alpha crystallin family protein [Actinomycetes bacterium KLBMP 9797]
MDRVGEPRPGTARSVERAFDYRISLPGDVDAEHADATMSHGLLTVRLPRAIRRPRRRVSITG